MGDDGLIEGKYRLGEVMRTTDQAVVHRAEHTGIQRQVAIKILAPTRAAEGPDAARIVRESRVVGAVAHRNVQSVVDSGVGEDGRPYIVYELIEGKTLGELIADDAEGIDPERAARLTNQLVDALAAVHAAGVVHRTIGPECAVVVEVRGGAELVKLRHFQDAVFTREDHRDRPGAPPPRDYIPPELQSSGRYDERADLYSAGAIYRALLTGSPHGRLASVADTPRRAVEQAMATHPEARFPEADLFQLVLAVILGHRPGRDDGDMPLDPLAADLAHLKLRRPTKLSYDDGEASSDDGVGEAKIELLTVLLVIEAIYRELGDRWSELTARIPDVEKLLPGSGNTELNISRGVSVEVLSRVLSAVDEIAGAGDLGLVAALGARVGRRGFTRLSPEIGAAGGPAEVIALFPKLWSTITRQGEVEIVETAPGAARIFIRRQVEPSLELTALAAGILRGVLEESGAVNPRVQTPTCEALGDDATIFRVRWDPW